MDSKEEENERPKPIRLGKIPIIAIIFPPIGLLMLIQHLLNKGKRRRKVEGEK